MIGDGVPTKLSPASASVILVRERIGFSKVWMNKGALQGSGRLAGRAPARRGSDPDLVTGAPIGLVIRGPFFDWLPIRERSFMFAPGDWP
jgi:hypothetical protein